MKIALRTSILFLHEDCLEGENTFFYMEKFMLTGHPCRGMIMGLLLFFATGSADAITGNGINSRSAFGTIVSAFPDTVSSAAAVGYSYLDSLFKDMKYLETAERLFDRQGNGGDPEKLLIVSKDFELRRLYCARIRQIGISALIHLKILEEQGVEIVDEDGNPINLSLFYAVLMEVTDPRKELLMVKKEKCIDRCGEMVLFCNYPDELGLEVSIEGFIEAKTLYSKGVMEALVVHEIYWLMGISDDGYKHTNWLADRFQRLLINDTLRSRKDFVYCELDTWKWLCSVVFRPLNRFLEGQVAENYLLVDAIRGGVETCIKKAGPGEEASCLEVVAPPLKAMISQGRVKIYTSRARLREIVSMLAAVVRHNREMFGIQTAPEIVGNALAALELQYRRSNLLGKIKLRSSIRKMNKIYRRVWSEDLLLCGEPGS